MATQEVRGSGRGWQLTGLLHPIKDAYNTLLKIASKPLSYLNENMTSKDEYGMKRPFELIFRMYELNNRINEMSRRRQIIMRSLLGMLAVVCVCIAFCAIYYCAILDSPRRAIDTLIGTFEYPSLPQRSRKVFLFFKISCAICIVYNSLTYLKEVYNERVSLMDHLEKEAAVIIPGQSTEARLDSTVPRVGDGCKTEKARQLIAMRRLFHRGQFKFDVVPEPEPVRVYEPTEEVIQAMTEAAELEAVKRRKDPKMLREFIRKRESQQGRRRVHFGNLKQRRSKGAVSCRTCTTPYRLNIIDEENSESRPSISVNRSNVSQIAHKSMKSHTSGTDSSTSSSTISWCTSMLAAMKAEGECLSPQMLDVLKMPTAIEKCKLLSEFFPDVPSAPLEGSVVPTRVIATGASDGAGNVAAESVAATAQKRVPLQTAKWPISGTCRPVRSRPPSPVITPTALKPPGLSSGGYFSSASKQRRTPSAGPGPKASTVADTAVESKKRYSRSAVRRVAPSNPARVTTPSRSSATPPPPSTPVSSPTRRPNSSVRRHISPTSRLVSPATRPTTRPPTPHHPLSPTTLSRHPQPATRQRSRPSSPSCASPQCITTRNPPSPPRTLVPQGITPPGTPVPQRVTLPSKLPQTLSPPAVRMPTPPITLTHMSMEPTSAPTSSPQQPQRTVVAERNRSRPPSQRRRTSTGDGGLSAVTAGPRQSVAENAYKKWRENFASAKPPMRVVPTSRGSGGGNQGSGMNRDRRPPSRTPVKPNIKSAEGTRMWHIEQRAEAAAKEQKTKDLAFKIASSVSEKTGTDGKVVTKDSDEKENAGGDSQSHTSLKKDSDRIVEVEKKSEIEICNLLDPRPDWSDSASSLSGISPSFTSAIQAFTEYVAMNRPLGSSDFPNIADH